MNAIEIVGIVLMVLGYILAVTEMLMPGFGAFGVGGGICMIAGVAMKADSLSEALFCVTVLALALAAAMTAIVVLFHSKKIKSPVELKTEINGKTAFLGDDDLAYFVGREAVAATDLRPAGKCDADGVLVDVRSQSAYIEKGTKVKIVKVDGRTLIVR